MTASISPGTSSAPVAGAGSRTDAAAQGRLRVLHVVASTATAWGGPASALRSLVPALAEHGVDCVVATTRLRQDGAPAPAIDGAETRPFPLGWASRFWTAHSPALRAFLDAELGAGRFDLVHVHELWHYAHYAAGHVALRHRVPWALSLRGALNEWQLRRNWKKRLYLSLVQRSLIESAAAIHALTASEAEALRALGYVAPVLVAPNGVHLPAAGAGADASKREFLARHPRLQGKQVVLYLGRLHPMKGVDVLLDALAGLANRFPNAALLIVGPDESGTRRRMAEAAHRAGLTDRTVFTGALEGAAKAAAFAVADMFVLPSHTEGFSNATLEAMAAGLPVVVSRQCHFPEVATAGAGFVVPAEAPPLADAVGALLEDEARRRHMGRKGRELVAERYSWGQVAAVMSDWYRNLAKGPGSLPATAR